MLAAKINPVVKLPNSGVPEDNSNTEPTPAIAVIQHKARKIPLFTVIGVTLVLLLIDFYFIFII
jgi:hypothetical protein